MAGLLAEEEDQQRTSGGNDIFGNGWYQEVLPMFCLWETFPFSYRLKLFFTSRKEILVIQVILNGL